MSLPMNTSSHLHWLRHSLLYIALEEILFYILQCSISIKLTNHFKMVVAFAKHCYYSIGHRSLCGLWMWISLPRQCSVVVHGAKFFLLLCFSLLPFFAFQAKLPNKFLECLRCSCINIGTLHQRMAHIIRFLA